MTLFLVIAVAMAAVALAWVLPVLLRRSRHGGESCRRAHPISRSSKTSLAELEQDVATGTLPQAQYQQAREDLERRAYEEAREPVAPVAVAPAPARRTAIVLAALLPICAAAMYWQFGTPRGRPGGRSATAGSKVTPQED